MSENTNNTLTYADVEPDIEKIQNYMREILANKPVCHILGEEFTDNLKQWDKADRKSVV